MKGKWVEWIKDLNSSAGRMREEAVSENVDSLTRSLENWTKQTIRKGGGGQFEIPCLKLVHMG